MPSRSRSRRQTLRLGSALTLVLAGGRLQTANAKGQILPEGDAYAPWGLWNDPSFRGAPLALVAAAVLAANPHDTQPWLFRISGDAAGISAIGICRAPSSRQIASSLASRTSRTVCPLPALRMSEARERRLHLIL